MRAKTRNVKIQFRITEEEYELLQNRASILGRSEGQTARSILLGGLAGFDEKQATFLYKLDHLYETMELLIDISSLGAAAGALPFPAKEEELGIEVNREALKKHLVASRKVGKTLVESIKKGKL
jgi:hypothetical protein